MRSKNLTLTVVLPVYNEAQRIRQTVARVWRYFSGIPGVKSELIVVNDGSTDTTAKELEALRQRLPFQVVTLPNNCGKGAAIRAGALEANGEWVLFMDADLATPLLTFKRFLEKANDADIIIGSRHVAHAAIVKKQPFIRRNLGQLFYRLVQWLFLPGMSDTNCGFKMYRRSVVTTMFPLLKIDRWGFDVEILYVAKKHGFRIVEVPVRWSDKRGSKVHVARAVFQTLAELGKIWYYDRRGDYNVKKT